MNTKLSRTMTTLGLFAMLFYGALMATGVASVNMMPQFLVSAFIFLTSGRMLRRRNRRPRPSDPRIAAIRPTAADLRHPWLEWVTTASILAVLAMLLMKPVDLTLSDAFHRLHVSDLFYSTAIP